MKSEIHPQWFENAKVTCVCGNEFTTGSTKAELKLDICSACHPFYTGKQKLIDVEGRVERFQKRYANFNAKLKKDSKPEQN
ncbi:MAG: 50S ribosomal protein L31 [Bdellovibrionales bacterium]|nr:50S ribosomal protein L31 [Bdellovibrionales bacterium]